MYLNKILLLFILAFMLICQGAKTQTDSSVYKNLDTLIFYRVSLTSGNLKTCNAVDNKSKTIRYFVNCREATEAEYRKYKDAHDNIGNCKPCVMKHLDESGKLLYTGVQYTDCPVGNWTEYYENGKVKISGHYKENESLKWKNLFKRGLCGVKHGSWTYYDSSGNVLKTEIYKDGELQK